MTRSRTLSEVQAATPTRRINLGFDKYSGLYVWALLVIVFSLWIPDLFLQVSNFKHDAAPSRPSARSWPSA